MLLILIKLSYLFILFYSSINALPVINRENIIHNSIGNSKENLTVPLFNKQELAAAAEPVPLMIPKLKIPKHFNLKKIAKNLKDFGIHSLKEDQHLEGLPLDRRGKINPEFHKEIFLGNHEAFESEIDHDEGRRDKKLEEIFNEADLDRDERVTKDELVNYLFKNVQLHLKEAKNRNTQLFLLIDANEDGKITWHEYAALYIRFHHMNVSDVRDLDEIDFAQDSHDSALQRELLKIRYRWTEADTDGDNEINVDEFLTFRHPEIAGRSYKNIVNDIIQQMDRDNDQKLNITEFAFLPSYGLEDKDNKEWEEMDKRWLEEQKQEFREFDQNNDGILTKEELLHAYDPMNRIHIDRQIKKLFSKVDDSPADGSLSLNEIQKHADIFTDLRILDTERVLHEEM
ncbi:unnamed protein product [Adineta steineri]|uniref:EF-hand domain-containing protein n=1 Tax=Adineta steineri TaxID=433720 RepID=A0A813VS43_9BILA|nr:unnamed protein product [Adineta steineri]CAF0938946.1 unnamed protein product [Adineta steineri]CAF3596559.1 unnamed protein product [Adineta steineri]CAF3600673.1 unnamed protein product [Adineta steineri]CAF3766828.1 unnamed protein product [Adineta steineri]